MLFDRLGFVPGKAPNGKTLLIIGAAGGVASIMTQLARRLTSLTVIGTASRPETQAWVKNLGADHVIDHAKPIAAALARIGFAAVDAANLRRAHALVESGKARGKVVLEGWD